MTQVDAKIPQLLSGVAEDLTHIVSSEIRLARAELKKGFSETAGGAGMMAGALVFAVPAITVLAFAAVALLSDMDMKSSAASLVVALVLGAIAFGLYSAGRKGLKSEHLHLEKTAQNIKQDVNVLKERSA